MRSDNQKIMRSELRQAWLKAQLPEVCEVRQLAGDASFREYFRVHTASSAGASYVLMDVPPTQETCYPFWALARAFSQLGLCVPEIYGANLEKGFLLLSDFGDNQLLHQLNSNTAEQYYHQAFQPLLKLHQVSEVADYALPRLDETAYAREWALFLEWYLQRHLNFSLTAADFRRLNHVYEWLLASVLQQPQVCVHRDFHSRNLMVLPEGRLGILDFQDAAWGPVTYDVMSLLRDCYIDWPYEQVKRWALHFQQQLLEVGVLKEEDPKIFLDWFDAAALQRHLKCIGIFARLHYRDHKPTYLKEIPRVLGYVREVCERQPVFKSLLEHYLP